MGEIERRKALVFVMAIVLVVPAATIFALTTTMSGSEPEPSNPESIASLQVSSVSWAGGPSTSF